jgi:iron complex transport system substrate-binding protein
MRIVSLVPHATELLFALGLGGDVVAVTHECDFPHEATLLPHITHDVLPTGLSAGEIDAAVRERTQQGQAIYELDERALTRLEPDLIVTQALCQVCAVSYDDVVKVAERIPSTPRVISLDPKTIGEAMGDIRTIAQATGARDAALDLVTRQRKRIDDVRRAVKGLTRPTVAALEWLDPVFVAGHWTPQLIDLAGGEDVLGLPGEKSRTAEWSEVEAAAPEVVVSMPCGYYAEQAAAETMRWRRHLELLGARVIALDAAAYFSRPGPRLVDGVELLGHLLHPELVPAPPTRRSIELDLRREVGPAARA